MPTTEKKAVKVAHRNFRFTADLAHLYEGYVRDARLDGNAYSEDFWDMKLSELDMHHARHQLSTALKAHRESTAKRMALTDDYSVPFTKLALVHIVDDCPFARFGPTYIGATWENGLWNILGAWDLDTGLAEQMPVNGIPSPIMAVDYSIQEFLRTFPGLQLEAIRF